MKKKVTALKALYISHLEVVHNVVRLHKSHSDANFEEISSLISSNGHSIEEVCCCGSNYYFYLFVMSY